MLAPLAIFEKHTMSEYHFITDGPKLEARAGAKSSCVGVRGAQALEINRFEGRWGGEAAPTPFK